MQIESKQFTVSSSSDHVLSFLAVPENLKKLLPAERIQEFSADEKQCSFKAQGGIIISLVFNERTASSVSYSSGTNSPFPFNLLISVEENNQVEQFYRGWVMDELIGMLILNPRGLAKIVKA